MTNNPKPTDAQIKLADVTQADREAAALALGYKSWDDATDYRTTGAQDRHRDNMVKHFAAHRLATEARAQGLVDALEAMLHAVCHETGFANAVRNDSGVAYPWEPLDIAEASARQALATWRRT